MSGGSVAHSFVPLARHRRLVLIALLASPASAPAALWDGGLAQYGGYSLESEDKNWGSGFERVDDLRNDKNTSQGFVFCLLSECLYRFKF